MDLRIGYLLPSYEEQVMLSNLAFSLEKPQTVIEDVVRKLSTDRSFKRRVVDQLNLIRFDLGVPLRQTVIWTTQLERDDERYNAFIKDVSCLKEEMGGIAAFPLLIGSALLICSKDLRYGKNIEKDVHRVTYWN